MTEPHHGAATWARQWNCPCDPCMDTIRHAEAERDGDIDEIAVELLTYGDDIWSTHTERVEATRKLRARGYTADRIAELLRTTSRSAQRYISELNAEVPRTTMGRAAHREPDALRRHYFRLVLTGRIDHLAQSVDFRTAA